jgi:hypothetical protein
MINYSYNRAIVNNRWRYFQSENDQKWIITDDKYRYSFDTPASAKFLTELWNKTEFELNYGNSTLTTIPFTENLGTVKFSSPPKSNWKWMFGDSPDVYFQFHIKNPPNRFQRWFFNKMTGIKWEKVD